MWQVRSELLTVLPMRLHVTVLDRTLVVWYILPYSALLTVSLCDT